MPDLDKIAADMACAAEALEEHLHRQFTTASAGQPGDPFGDPPPVPWGEVALAAVTRLVKSGWRPGAGAPTASTGPARPHAATLPHDQLTDAVWRTGRTLGGRTLYAVTGGGRKADILIGHMDTERLGERVAADHNAAIRLGDPDELAYQLHEAQESEAQSNATAAATRARVAEFGADAANTASALLWQIERATRAELALAEIRAAARALAGHWPPADPVAHVITEHGPALCPLSGPAAAAMARLRRVLAETAGITDAVTTRPADPLEVMPGGTSAVVALARVREVLASGCDPERAVGLIRRAVEPVVADTEEALAAVLAEIGRRRGDVPTEEATDA